MLPVMHAALRRLRHLLGAREALLDEGTQRRLEAGQEARAAAVGARMELAGSIKEAVDAAAEVGVRRFMGQEGACCALCAVRRAFEGGGCLCMRAWLAVVEGRQGGEGMVCGTSQSLCGSGTDHYVRYVGVLGVLTAVSCALCTAAP